MYTKPCSMADQDSESEEKTDFLPDFKDVNLYTQQALKSVLQATKCSNELPATGNDFDYYSSFQGVRDVLDIEGKRILHIIQNVLKYQNVKGNLSENSDAVEVEDKFDILIDANDYILERVGNWLDEASGVKKNDNTLVIASATPRHGASASWNKKSPASGKGSTMTSYRLLAAKNIQRPQLRFKDKIDNSNRPFVPRIKHKPNAVKSLEESLKLPDFVTDEVLESPEFMYPHPYQLENDQLKLSEQMLSACTPRVPKSLDDTPLTILDKVSDLVQLCESLRSSQEIAVDLEHHSYRTYQGITCLMQISTREEDYLVDTLALRNDLHMLNEIFTDPNIVKVFHGAESDITWLQRDFGIYVVNLFDTGQAARVMSFARFSLAHLLKMYCDVDAEKQYQLADWRIRPLPVELVKYAREDTHYLLYIYDKLKNDLIDRGNQQKNLLHSTLQRSKEVALKVYKKPVFKADEDYIELYKKTKKIFNSRQLMCLKNLYSWRDHVARTEDESTAYVLPNHMLMQIAEILPRERQGVFACCNPIPPLVRQYLNEMHSIVMEARETPLENVVPAKSSKQPSEYQHPKYDPDSLLNCPHDMSHQSETGIIQNSTVLDSDLVAKSSSMFGRSSIIVVVKKQPLLTAFSSPVKNTDITAAQKRATKIRALFHSPYEKYLPTHDSTKGKKLHTQSTNQSSDFLTSHETNMPEFSWKLMRNTVKRKEREPSPVEVEPVQEPPAKRQKVEVRDSGTKVYSISQIKMHSSKKHAAGRFSSLTDNPSDQPATTKKKKKKQDVIEDISEDFTPYDYSKADMKMFQGGASSKKDVFDPAAELRQKGKSHKARKHGSSNSKKSYYGGQGGSSQSWSKK